MLAAKRSFEFGGKMYQTPMVVPSFSSRGFDDVAKLIAVAREYLTDEVLISAYDLMHSGIRTKGWTFPTLTFLDSGGYEKGAETDLTDLRQKVHYPKTWTKPFHRKVLKSWDFSNPTVIISYDNPVRPISLLEQIGQAKELFADFPSGGSEILLKAETSGRKKPYPAGYLNLTAVKRAVRDLKEFKVIGVTEKELGRSLFERMAAIAIIRRSLTAVELDTPIHVFGSLDPISTPLYFIAGADIFDGLTWLEYLQTFPMIGPVTAYHLAKNLGISVAKPDRHLVRIASMFGYSSVHEFCGDISKSSGENVAVVDITLWRYGVLGFA